MVYGYARVSTAGQAKDGNSLECQAQALTDAGAQKVYSDSFTGTKIDRPAFKTLLDTLKDGDTLIVTKLDRIARSLVDGYQLVDSLIDKGIKVNILNLGVMDNKPASKAMRGMFLVFAQFERDMIVERTREGKAIAKTKPGFTEGRPQKYTKEQLKHAVELLKTHSYKEVSEMTRISESTIQRAARKGLMEE